MYNDIFYHQNIVLKKEKNIWFIYLYGIRLYKLEMMGQCRLGAVDHQMGGAESAHVNPSFDQLWHTSTHN